MLRLGNRLAWLIAPALLVVMISLNPPKPTYLMGDFRAFYCAGQVIAHHANPYLNQPLRSCEVVAGPPAEPLGMRSVTLPAPLPPYALLLFVPFAALPFPLAAGCFELFLIAAMTAAIVLYARVAAVPSLWLYLAFAGITASVTYYAGQPVPFVLLAFAGAALAVRHQRWSVAAACVLITTMEPHLALPAVAAMVIAPPEPNDMTSTSSPARYQPSSVEEAKTCRRSCSRGRHRSDRAFSSIFWQRWAKVPWTVL